MRLLLLMLFSVTYLVTFSQTHLNGRITDNKNHPLAGISISLKDSYDGSTSDSSGRYSFVTNEKGSHLLIASATGYRGEEKSVDLKESNLVVDLQLRELVTELKAVVISAGAFEASESKRATVLNPIDIVTTASANADVTAAIKTLPGTQQVGEQEGLFVRGGTAAESKVFIDGTPVNNFYFSSVPDIAQRGRFSPFLFKGTVFSSGGYSAQYGQALSSVLLLESIDLPEQSSASIGISTVGLSAGYQHLAKNKKSSWGISVNHTNLWLYFQLVKQKVDYFQVPLFNNIETNYRVKTSKTGIVKFYGYFNSSTLGLRKGDIDSTSLKDAFGLDNLNYYTNLSWKERLGSRWKMQVGLSYSNNRDKILGELQDNQNTKQVIPAYPYNQKNFNIVASNQFAVGKVVLERKFMGLNVIRFGGEYFYNKDNSTFRNTNIQTQNIASTDNFTAAFAETDIYLTNDLAAKIGTRVENSSLLAKTNLAPRVSLAYKAGKDAQFSFAYGIFYQKPENSFFTRAYKFNDLQYNKATHYILNYQKLTRDYTLRVEAFYKKYQDLIKTYPVYNSNDSIANTGYGNAKGFEIFWRDRKTFNGVDYWISYSYLDTKRDYLNYPGLMKPGFAADHTASLVIKKFVTKMKTGFNASYTFATGRPYYNIRYDNYSSHYKIYDNGKTNGFNSLSFSMNYLPNINKKGAGRFSVLVFSVTNILNTNNIYGYNYSYNGANKQPITPPAKQFFFLGYFLSFGVDRSDDIINNNL